MNREGLANVVNPSHTKLTVVTEFEGRVLIEGSILAFEYLHLPLEYSKREVTSKLHGSRHEGLYPVHADLIWQFSSKRDTGDEPILSRSQREPR